MTGNQEPDFPVLQQDHETAAVITETTVHWLQIQDPEDGRWVDWLTPREDRDELTRIQVDRAKRYPDERRRVLTKVSHILVDEVEGDGKNETSREELFARNDENTKRLLEENTKQQPGT